MSVEKPGLSAEGLRNSIDSRISFVTEKLHITPQSCESFDYIFKRGDYPEILSDHGIDTIEISVQSKGIVAIETVYRLSDTQQQADYYTLRPQNLEVEHYSAISDVSEQITNLKNEHITLRTDIAIYERDALRAYNEMERLIQLEGDDDDLQKYKERKEFIHDLRTGKKDPDEELREMLGQYESEEVIPAVPVTKNFSDELLRDLDHHEFENEAYLRHLLEKAAIINTEVGELLKKYDDARSHVGPKTQSFEALGDEIHRLSNVQFTETTTVNPQRFVQLLDLLVAIAGKY